MNYRSSVIALYLLMLVGGMTERALGQGCQDVLTITGRDVTDRRHMAAFSEELYSKHCKSSYSIGGDEGDLEIFGILSLGGSSNREKRDAFCREEEKRRDSLDWSEERSSLVVQEAIKAWETCMHLKSQGINVDYVQVNSSQVIVGMRRGGRPADFEGAIYDGNTLSCNGRTKPGEKPVGITGASFFPLPDGRLWSLRCARKASSDREGVAIDGGTLTLVTSEGNLAVPLPPIRILQAETSADLRSEIERLRAEIREQKKILKGIETDLEGKVAKTQLVEAVRFSSENPWREIVRLRNDPEGLEFAPGRGWKRVYDSFMVVLP